MPPLTVTGVIAVRFPDTSETHKGHVKSTSLGLHPHTTVVRKRQTRRQRPLRLPRRAFVFGKRSVYFGRTFSDVDWRALAHTRTRGTRGTRPPTEVGGCARTKSSSNTQNRNRHGSIVQWRAVKFGAVRLLVAGVEQILKTRTVPDRLHKITTILNVKCHKQM